MKTFKIGSDPELFAIDSDGNFVSGHDLIPGTKQSPHFVPCGAVQVDGVALEFNTFPASSEDQFFEHIMTVRMYLEELMHEKRPDLSLIATPTAYFKKDYFDSLPMEAKLLGCTPDYNAYTCSQNTPPETKEPFRTGAGHIHIGWGEYLDPHGKEHFQDCVNVVKQLDAVLYPLSMSWDQDTKRRTLYGSMGSFRPKTYGVEYRPLSNAFLNSEETIRLVYKTTIEAVDLLFNQGVILWEKEAAA